MERSSKKEKGLMDMDNSVVIWGRESVRGINGSRKNTIRKKDLIRPYILYEMLGVCSAENSFLC